MKSTHFGISMCPHIWFRDRIYDDFFIFIFFCFCLFLLVFFFKLGFVWFTFGWKHSRWCRYWRARSSVCSTKTIIKKKNKNGEKILASANANNFKWAHNKLLQAFFFSFSRILHYTFSRLFLELSSGFIFFYLHLLTKLFLCLNYKERIKKKARKKHKKKFKFFRNCPKRQPLSVKNHAMRYHYIRPFDITFSGNIFMSVNGK